MSSSIAIPKRKQPRHSSGYSYGASSSAASSSSSPYSSWAGNVSSQPWSPSTPSSTSLSSSSSPVPTPSRYSERRPSLLSSSISKSEYTVVNVAGPDGPPRLITCVKASQGFDWNQDIFLPSYMDYDSSDLERKSDPVQDIVLTDEEAASLLPQ